MTYKGGRHIAKWQWDQIYDPAITTSLIKYDEDGEFWISVVKIGAKAAVNILVQMSIIYLTNDDVEEFEQAWHYVDVTEVAINAAIPAASLMKKFKIFNKIKSPDELEALVDIAGNLYLCIKDKQINSATDFIKELNICGAQAIFDYVLGTVADVSIDKAVQKIRRIIPNFSYKKSHIGEQQDANAPPQISANTDTKALPEAKQQLLLPEKISHLKHKIVDFPNLNKELDKLGDLKEQFFKDFDELADDKIILFEQNTKLVDAWKRLYQKGASKLTRQLIAEGINIENVRPGTNGKYAIIGRSMDTVKEAANVLKSLGADVEILDKKWIGERTYFIKKYKFKNSEGTPVKVNEQEITLNKAFGDLITNTSYRRNEDNNFVIEEDIHNTQMYKFNEMWIKDIKDSGYEIIDIGNPSNKQEISIFYNMEKTILNFK